MTDLIRLERQGNTATLILDRPEKMNALNADMWRGLAGHLHGLASDDTLRCVILRGSGAHFGAGADMAEFAALRGTAAEAAAYGAMMLETLHTLRDLPHPTVAVITGNCLGAGLELAVMCDLRLAAADARFGVPIQRAGITMPYPELEAFVGLMGRAAVLEMLLEGEIHDAAWALARGLVTRVIPLAGLGDEAAALVARISAGSPLSHRNHKKFTRRCMEKRPLSETDIAESYAAVESGDYREGVAAFLARRRPAFTGR